MKEFDIQFTGLKVGKHYFEFEVGNTFFNVFELSEIDDGQLIVNIELEVQSTMIVANFSISGTVQVVCDRCSDPLHLEIEHDDRLIYKIEDEKFEDNENVIVLTQADVKFNVAEPIYQFIVIALPKKRVHKEGDCNEEMIKKLEELKTRKDDDDIDPRWSALKDLN